MQLYTIYEYIYLAIITIYTIVLANKYKSKNPVNPTNIYSCEFHGLILCVFLMLFVGFRPENGGFGDSANYRLYYYTYYEGSSFVFDPNTENVVFDNLLALWGSLGLGISNFFFLNAAIYFGCMYAACKRIFSKDVLLAFLVCLGAFSTFSYSANGFKAGAAASIFLLGVSFYKNWKISIPLVLLSYGFHHSMIMPVAAFVAVNFYKNPKTYFYVWCASVLLSAANVSFFQNIFMGLAADNSDARGAAYLDTNNAGDWKGKSGFRIDFILYSAMPVFVGYYALFKKRLSLTSKYIYILNMYMLLNSVWMLCMYMQYTNRVAYLSWFLYPIVLIYPFLNEEWGFNRYRTAVKVAFAHLGFTLFMTLIFY